MIPTAYSVTLNGSGFKLEDTITAESFASTSFASTSYDGTISEDLLAAGVFERVMNLLSSKPVIQYKCQNCGAHLDIDENKHIIICKYCDAVYAIGKTMINDLG